MILHVIHSSETPGCCRALSVGDVVAVVEVVCEAIVTVVFDGWEC